MVRALALLPLALVGCRALNPAFEDGASSGGSTSSTSGRDTTTTHESADATTSKETADGSASQSGTTGSGGGDSTGLDDSTDSNDSNDGSSGDGPLPVCETPPSLDIQMPYECESQGRFFAEYCTTRSVVPATEGSKNTISLARAIGCGIKAADSCGGNGAPLGTLSIDSVPLPEIISADTTYDCGITWIAGHSDGTECVVDGVFLFADDPSFELLVGVANFADIPRGDPMLLGNVFDTPVQSRCGPEPGMCSAVSGQLGVQLGDSAVVPHEAVGSATISIDGYKESGMQEVLLYNASLTRDPSCGISGGWAAVHQQFQGLF